MPWDKLAISARHIYIYIYVYDNSKSHFHKSNYRVSNPPPRRVRYKRVDVSARVPEFRAYAEYRVMLETLGVWG